MPWREALQLPPPRDARAVAALRRAMVRTDEHVASVPVLLGAAVGALAGALARSPVQGVAIGAAAIVTFFALAVLARRVATTRLARDGVVTSVPVRRDDDLRAHYGLLAGGRQLLLEPRHAAWGREVVLLVHPSGGRIGIASDHALVLGDPQLVDDRAR